MFGSNQMPRGATATCREGMPALWGQGARRAGFVLAALLGIVVLVRKHHRGGLVGFWKAESDDESYGAQSEWLLSQKDRQLGQSSAALFKALFQTGNDTSARDRKRANETNSTKLDTDPNIVGGVPADENPSYGFSAGTGLCGGTLIRPDILLTAAHCVGNFVDGALMGGTTLDGASSTFIEVASELPHPGYDATTDDNDIMLVKLATPSSAPLQQINFDASFPPVGSEVSVIGYGLTAEDGTSASSTLLQTQNTILSFEECNSYYGTISEERMICMGDAAGGRDACQGDSGGPMFFNGIQVGIVSFGDGCARPGVPSVFARTSGFQDWINDGICALSTDPQLPCDEVTVTSSPGQAPVDAPVSAPASAPMQALPPASVPTSSAPNPTVSTPVVAPPVSTPVQGTTGAPTKTPTVEATEETEQPSIAISTDPPGQVPVSTPSTPIKSPLSSPVKTTAPVPTSVGSPARPPNKAPVRPVLSPLTNPARPPNKAPVRPVLSPLSTPAQTPNKRPMVPSVVVSPSRPTAAVNPASPIVSPSRPSNGMGMGTGSGTGTGAGNGMGMMRRPMRMGGGMMMNGMGWESRRTDAPSPTASPQPTQESDVLVVPAVPSSGSMNIFGMGKGGGLYSKTGKGGSSSKSGKSGGKSGGSSGNGMMKGGRQSLWKLITGKEDGRFRIEESEQQYIQPLVTRRKHHEVLEDWYREHVVKQDVKD